MSVDIVDVGSGNVLSVKNWIERSNMPARIVSAANQLSSELIILPGVGSAGPYMDRLCKKNFHSALQDHVARGDRLMGICLGFQLMMDFSEEDGTVEGLGLLDGYAERLQHERSHNCWEPLQIKKSDVTTHSSGPKHNLTRKQILNGRVFYNHEYGVVSREKTALSQSVSLELPRYSGLIIRDNLIGFQFHPEKSQRTGTELLNLVL